ncbi:hypothetical protein IMCC1989_1821 [gamma proteobacterium IMCC1989]|nr:hypothetical protein IMCC1989_1821 [gamma proteobacterium IMCC1989]
MEFQPLGKAITRMDAGVEPTWTYSRRALNNGWKSMSPRWLR